MSRRTPKAKPAKEPTTETGVPSKKSAMIRSPRKRGGGWDYDDDTDIRPGHTWDNFDRAGRGKPRSEYQGGAHAPWRS